MKKLKQALSLTLALALSLALTVPAFAEEMQIISPSPFSQLTFSDAISRETVRGRTFNSKIGDVTLYTVKQGTTVTTISTFNRAAIQKDGSYDIDHNSSESFQVGWLNTQGMPEPFFETLTFGPEHVGLWQFDCNHYGYFYLNVLADNSSVSNQPTGPQVSDWAKDQVTRAAANGLVADGMGNNYQVNITRAQFAATAVKLYEAMSGQAAPAPGDSVFVDTSAPAVIQAAALGFVNGVGDGKFAPDDLVTREQAAVMLSRVYTKLGGNIPGVTATSFADNGAVSGWAKDSVAFMAGKGIVNGVGDNNFAPQGNASIEQALAIALRMFENLK